MDYIDKKDTRMYFKIGCNSYARLFCEKHGYDFEEYGSWCGDIVGGSFDTGADVIVDMQTIIDDIDNDFPEEELLKWYDYTKRLYFLSCDRGMLNFKSWCKGAPRISDEELTKLEESKQKIEQLKQELKDHIDNGF